MSSVPILPPPRSGTSGTRLPGIDPRTAAGGVAFAGSRRGSRSCQHHKFPVRTNVWGPRWRCFGIDSLVLASLMPASWNQIADWLQQIDAVRGAASPLGMPQVHFRPSTGHCLANNLTVGYSLLR